MKSQFSGYFKKSDEEREVIWSNSIFVLDANILLNLYRYSETTKSEVLNILKSDNIKNSLWLPHQAASEYLENRTSVIFSQEKSYMDTKKSVENMKKDLENTRSHPFVTEATMQKLTAVFTELNDELELSLESHRKKLTDDDIKRDISELFEQKVSPAYSGKELLSIAEEGVLRYKDKIPPGFMDDSKNSDSDSISAKMKKYGDLILWYQIIDIAKTKGKNIIFVTDDKKEDWWEIFKGKTIGARPELIKEFKEKTDFEILIYQINPFLKHVTSYLQETVSQESVREIQNVSSRNVKKLIENKSEILKVEHSQLMIELMVVDSNITNLNLKSKNLKDKKAMELELGAISSEQQFVTDYEVAEAHKEIMRLIGLKENLVSQVHNIEKKMRNEDISTEVKFSFM
ncbi:MAG: hypothetical protein COA90_07590 [Gammaproteobacteria bacterium]|nr:MAG: hypothetical protein COA90_07590 [Gammaproteobacteria bacterium]